MRAVVQRVTSASVTVGDTITGKIDKGLMVLIGVQDGDDDKDKDYIAKKVANLRVFDDQDGVMNLSCIDIGASILCVSQFTLMGDVRKGNRPSYFAAGAPEDARDLYNRTVEAIRGYGIHVEEGVYREEMLVSLVNDGPVTILLDSKKTF